MSNRNGRDHFAFGGLSTGLLVIFAVAVIGIGIGSFNAIHARREATKQATTDKCQNANSDSCESLHANTQAANANEDAVDVAIWQMLLNVAGLVAVGFTVVYTRAAWREAQKSAKAATDALDDARRDGAAQTERSNRELKIATDNLELARRGITEADRAWLSVDVALESGVGFYEEEISLNAKIVVTNIGRSPARNVLTHFELSAESYDHQRQVTKRLGSPRIHLLAGHILFPGQSIPWRGELRMTRASFLENLAKLRAL